MEGKVTIEGNPQDLSSSLVGFGLRVDNSLDDLGFFD